MAIGGQDRVFDRFIALGLAEKGEQIVGIVDRRVAKPIFARQAPHIPDRIAVGFLATIDFRRMMRPKRSLRRVGMPDDFAPYVIFFLIPGSDPLLTPILWFSSVIHLNSITIWGCDQSAWSR